MKVLEIELFEEDLKRLNNGEKVSLGGYEGLDDIRISKQKSQNIFDENTFKPEICLNIKNRYLCYINEEHTCYISNKAIDNSIGSDGDMIICDDGIAFKDRNVWKHAWGVIRCHERILTT